MNKIEIHNVVATASLGTTMDLTAITKAFKHVEYSPKRFPGLSLPGEATEDGYTDIPYR